MVWTSLIEGRFSASGGGGGSQHQQPVSGCKCPRHGHRGSCSVVRAANWQRVNMHPWSDTPPPTPAGSAGGHRSSVQQGAVSGDEEDEGSRRYSEGVPVPGVGDHAGDSLVQVRTRSSRSSSSLEPVLEETGGAVGLNCQDESLTMPSSTCAVRRARGLTQMRHGHHHHHQYHHEHHQPPPQELPPGASAMSSISATSLGPPIVFNPPGVDWQRAQAAALGLTLEFPLPTPPSPGSIGTFAPNVPPRRCRPVAGDGNCLFRSISWWITGSEEQHMEVRQLIADELRRDGGRQYESIAAADYVDESQVDSEGVWGSDVEIFVAATMLRTPIAVYSAFGDHQFLWQVFQPLERQEAAVGPANHDCLIYLQNSYSHFEPVTDV